MYYYEFCDIIMLLKLQMEALVDELVSYLLIANQSKIAIKRQDIIKHVFKDNSKAFSGVLNQAKAKLENVFGLKLVELEKNCFLLVNNIASAFPEDFEPDDHTRRGLLMTILSLILLDGNEIGENELYENLRKIGVDVDHQHDVFGDVRQLINENFVKQMYLECEKQTAMDPPKILYRWGARARAETTEEDVQDFISSVVANEDS